MRLEADVLVRGARMWTDGSVHPGADAVAIAGGRVLALGDASELSGLVGAATRVLDAGGATVTPGITDAHIHLVQWARSLEEVDLGGSTSASDAAGRVARFIAEHPERDPVVGRGWDEDAWPDRPERGVLDGVAAGRAVLLHSKDFHRLWVSSAALERCGIDRRCADPPGGRIARDAAGEPNGILIEHAVRLCATLLDRSESSGLAGLRAAASRLNAWGVTAIHDFEGPDAHRLLRALCDERPLALRVLMHVPHAELDSALSLGLASGLGDDAFRLGAVKLFADGTLGSRTAAMLAPYEGTHDRGMELLPARQLEGIVRRALSGGVSVAVHAIGDGAARSVIDAFERSAELIPRVALPPRIEHLQLVHPDDQPRLAALGVAASMQPVHAVSDAERAERAWGERVAHSYPWRALWDRGTLVAFGSDAPVEPPRVAVGLHAAVTRSVPGRPLPFTPAQCLTLDEALTAYTEQPARLAGTWPRLGTLRPGAAADLVIWSADLHRLPARELSFVEPAATMVAGVVVWERSAPEPRARAERPAHADASGAASRGATRVATAGERG